MRIAFDISDLATARADGTTRYTFELARRLPQLAAQHQWLYHTPASSALVEQATRGQGVKTVITPWPKYWTQLRLPLALYQQPANVLFMPIQQIPYIRPRKLRTVAVVHDLAFHYYPEQFTRKDWLLLHTFTAYVARQADHLIAVSQATADDIAKYYGRSAHVTVIHHGVDHEHFKPLVDTEREQSWLKLSSVYPTLRRPYILFVGQLQPRKNLVRLVEAFEQLKANQPELQLVIAGGHGWLQAPILDRITASSAGADIIVTGRVTDDILPSLYHHAAVFVLPSLYEGFGMPILEAMACGTPVVTSNVSSLPEVAGNAAVLIDPVVSESIAHGMSTILRDPAPWRDGGRKQAAKFTWDKTAAATLSLLTG